VEEAMKALSIKHPWAWAIVHAGKDIENRTWECRYRGEILIHASALRTPKRGVVPESFLDEWDDIKDVVDAGKISLPPVTYRSLCLSSRAKALLGFGTCQRKCFDRSTR
jgi:hypothetical protein